MKPLDQAGKFFAAHRQREIVSKQHQELCECGNNPKDGLSDHEHPLHGDKCKEGCEGYACTYGCGTCFCSCHD